MPIEIRGLEMEYDIENEKVELISLEDIGINEEIVKPKPERILNKKITKYQIFKNNHSAMTEFKEVYENKLKYIQNKFSLDILNESNYKVYQKIIELEEQNNTDDLAYSNMLKFFDIYENTDVNEELDRYIDEYNKERNIGLLSLIDVTAPSDSDKLADRYYDYPSTRNSGINLKAAIDYAMKYAKSGTYNKAYYYYNGSDCTNFVSQILKAGGVKEVYTGNQFSGWWYREKNNVSVSWIQARTFARYMGVGYTCTSSWKTFTSNVRQGDIIAFDRTRDGDYDHMAFLCAASGTELYIAQHSSDYLKNSSDTDWPNAIKKGYRLARIRR